jgi:hypothetical protein
MFAIANVLDIDHTTSTGKGYLMQADLSKRQVNDYARLRSPVLANVQCMTFYYHLFGHSGTLNLYMADGNNMGVPVWTRAGTQGDVWRFGRFSTTKNNVNMIFEGRIHRRINDRTMLMHLFLR